MSQIADKQVEEKIKQVFIKMQCNYFRDVTRYTIITDEEISKLAKRVWIIRESFTEKDTLRKNIFKNKVELLQIKK